MLQGEIDDNTQRRLLHALMRIRLVEETIAKRYAEQQMRCPVHLSIGQEAIAVGLGEALQSADSMMSNHRSHAHFLAKGGSLKRMLAEIYGRAQGCAGGWGGSQHLIDLPVNFLGSTPIVGGTIPIATGVAWATSMSGEDAVTAAFMGDGATEEGVWHESLNFAALHHLPIIYICENNTFSVNTPLWERQPKRPIVGLAAAHGLRVMTGDGNNAQEVFCLAREARRHAAFRAGPVLIELATYRWREHCGPNNDDDLGCRPVEEIKSWRARDPVERQRKYVIDKGIATEADVSIVRQSIEKEIKVAFEYALSCPEPAEPDWEGVSPYAD